MTASPPGASGGRLESSLDTYLAGLEAPAGELDDEAAERVARARSEVVAAHPGHAVPVLADGLDRPSFAAKGACYGTMIALGERAVPAIRRELDRRGPAARLWLAAALRQLGDERGAGVPRSLLAHDDPYVRHLAALAAVFQGVFERGDARAVTAALVDALDSDATIEGSAFTVAGAALACLVAAAGAPLLPPEASVTFYNYERFAFPPPVHPFPFPSDYLVGASENRHVELRAAAKAWWAGLDEVMLHPVEPRWPVRSG